MTERQTKTWIRKHLVLPRDTQRQLTNPRRSRIPKEHTVRTSRFKRRNKDEDRERRPEYVEKGHSDEGRSSPEEIRQHE